MLNISLRVRNIIKKFNTSDPYKIAKHLKVEIITTNVPQRVHGFWRRILRKKIIFIDKKLTEEWQIKAVICHEIGHIILHPQYKSYCMAGRTYYSCTKREDEANRFSAALFMCETDTERQCILDFLENGYKK